MKRIFARVERGLANLREWELRREAEDLERYPYGRAPSLLSQEEWDEMMRAERAAAWEAAITLPTDEAPLAERRRFYPW